MFDIDALLFDATIIAIVAIVGTWIVRHIVCVVADMAAYVDERRATGLIALAEARGKQALSERAVRDLPLVTVKGMPMARRLLSDGSVTDAQFTLIDREIDALRTHPNVPHTITYSPHMVKNTTALESEVTEAEAPALQVADFWSLYNGGKLPAHGFLMGYNLEDGQPVIANWKQLYSALIGGMSGSGKSTLMREILAQSALQGGKFVVLDPHYGAGEESTGASLMPLRNLMLCDVASDEKQMVDALHFVSDIGRRRLSGQDTDKSPLILIVDETTALLQRSNVAAELTNVLGQISQETRKVGVYAMCLGQQFKNNVMDTTVRNSFVSMIATRSRRDVARVMSGNTEFAKQAETLTTGQAVWMQPDGTVTKFVVPNTTAQHIWLVAQTLGAQNEGKTEVQFCLPPPESNLPDDEDSDDTEGIGKASGRQPEGKTTGDATEMRIVDLFLSGTDPQEIVKVIFNVDSNGGRKYIEKRDYIYTVMRDYWRSDRGA